MPDTALVRGSVLCPNCGELVLNGVRCQWGAVPGETYSLGDPITWVHDKDGIVIPPFRVVRDGTNGLRWNSGEPVYPNVILFDVLFEADAFTSDLRCSSCGARVAAATATVRDGRFIELRALLDPDVTRVLGAARGKAEIVIMRADGTLWPRVDWYDHALEYAP